MTDNVVELPVKPRDLLGTGAPFGPIAALPAHGGLLGLPVEDVEMTDTSEVDDG